jgi:hypothetical protein
MERKRPLPMVRHTEPAMVRGYYYYAHQSIPAMVRTRLTENKLEWRQFDYEFEQYSYVSRFCAGNARNRPLRCCGQMGSK